MPQISSLSWFFLFIYFILIYLIFMVCVFFMIYSKFILNFSKNMNMNHFNFKW